MKKLMAFLLAAAIAVGTMGTACLSVSAEDETVYGDVDGSGACDSYDALTVLRTSVHKIDLPEHRQKLADVNADSKVTSVDALYILKYSVGMIDGFPVTWGNLVLNRTILDNSAYSLDSSADNSFVLDISNLEPCTVYTVKAPSDADISQMLYAFQGLFNRQFMLDSKHTSLLYVMKDYQADPFWLDYCLGQGVMSKMEKVSVRTIDDFLSTFSKQLIQCGMTLWDQAVPATANVAETICGCDGFLPVMNGSYCQSKLEALGVETKLSLVGRFTGDGTIWGTSQESSGSAKNDAYRWALEKYFDRCSSEYIGYSLDGAVYVSSNPFSQQEDSEFNCLENIDYLIARHAFIFDLQPSVEEVCDDRNQPFGTDHETFIMILERRYERANKEFGRFMGFTPWWVKYTSDTSINGVSNGTLGGARLEWLCCQYLTSYNLAMEADAQYPASMTNGSFYYKYRVTAEKFETKKPAEKMTFDPTKQYYTVFAGDYDSSAWMKYYVTRYWKDSARGQLPLMWTFNPNLSYRIPMEFEYLYSTATDNDYIVADEGAGYIMPGQLIRNVESNQERTPEEGLDIWSAYCKKFYELFDMDITGFIINATAGDADTRGINANIMSCYNKFSPVGSFTNAGSNARSALALYDDVPYVYMYNQVQFASDGTPDTNGMYSYDTGVMSNYNFTAYRTVVQSPSTIQNLVNTYSEYASKRRGREYVYVDPYNFFDLIRQSGQGNSYN